MRNVIHGGHRFIPVSVTAVYRGKSSTKKQTQATDRTLSTHKGTVIVGGREWMNIELPTKSTRNMFVCISNIFIPFTMMETRYWDQYIHRCGTTNIRWRDTAHIAGSGGKALECQSQHSQAKQCPTLAPSDLLIRRSNAGNQVKKTFISTCINYRRLVY